MSERKSTNFNWELYPNKGFGNIPFGLNISQIDFIENTLGKLNSLYNPLNSNSETYELLKGIVSDEEIKELMKQMEDINIDQNVKIQEFSSLNGMKISFEDELLTDFFATDFVTNLHFQSIPIFSSNPLFLIKEISTILSEIPLAKGKEIIFPKNHIYLYDFLNEDGHETSHKERTVNWRNASRILGVSIDDYKELNLYL
ncbi:hypothetical protein H1R17_11830 [Flavobacterium sp. xlx-214]|uniref:hypothetical protein n=1 Tax=unclassified Flavobacterium TaxID=196869 RepID=UPI0013D247BC|nr:MULTISPECIES: hypothetical protein [unclassified Flavobacterium]MBA5794046.1 hypothetical protein [Flavobacterium sp. xlx-221]QMI83139.1 hypothetical protein H1R17_11830 [Flavobacterium sp. xlx-214]